MKPPPFSKPETPDLVMESLDLDLGEYITGDHSFVRLVFLRRSLPENYRRWDLDGVKEFLSLQPPSVLSKGVWFSNHVEDFQWGPELNPEPKLIVHDRRGRA